VKPVHVVCLCLMLAGTVVLGQSGLHDLPLMRTGCRFLRSGRTNLRVSRRLSRNFSADARGVGT
jgi:hypothetical protein